MNVKTIIILLLIFTCTKSSAQLCQGSLGDPIVNITFGSGNNPGAPLSAATTDYVYVATDCPNDGFYTVRSNTLGCFLNSWHNVSSDHTGNGNGYFMLVNATEVAGKPFYVDTVRGLCGNTTYEFASWIMNVTAPVSCGGSSIQPNLTFEIKKTDGTLLQSYNTNNIPQTSAPVWRQYGFFFVTPVGIADVVVRIVNNASGGCGNDLALDDITFRPCGPLLTPAILSQPTTTVTLCAGNAATYNFGCTVSGGYNNPVYQWQKKIDNGTWNDIPGETNLTLSSTFTGTEPVGSYAFRLAVAETGNLGSSQCRIASSPLTIRVADNPVTTAISNSPLCEGRSLILTGTGGTTYNWTGPGSFSGDGSPLEIPNIELSQAGKYYVLVKNNDGCEHLDSTIVNIDPSPGATVFPAGAAICPGDSISLSAGGGIGYEWIPAEGLSASNIATPRASPAVSTLYSVVVSNSFNCTDTASINLQVVTPARADAGPDRYMIEGQPIELSGNISGDYTSFSWANSPYLNNPFSLQPVVNPPIETKFILNVVSPGGCGINADTMKVFVYKDVYVPNVFTPNGDSKNDTWFIPALNAFREYELNVFNRYGELLYRLKNENKPWDGKFKNKDLPVGAYVYVLNIKNFQPLIKGTVMILR